MISSYMFANNYALKEIIIPSSVTSIGTYSFYFCSALTSVALTSGLTVLSQNMFAYAYSLKQVTIPSSINSIGINNLLLVFELYQKL